MSFLVAGQMKVSDFALCCLCTRSVVVLLSVFFVALLFPGLALTLNNVLGPSLQYVPSLFQSMVFFKSVKADLYFSIESMQDNAVALMQSISFYSSVSGLKML